jgi:hypothetical protein
MSTKTTFKRIALVTVAALGFGGLSVVVAPMANAAGKTPTAVTVGTLPTAAVGVQVTVPVTITVPITTTGDTFTATVKVTSAPTGSALAGSAKLGIGADGLAGATFITGVAAAGSSTFATLTIDEVASTSVCMATTPTQKSDFMPSVSADFTSSGWETPADASCSISVKFTPDKAGSYTFLVSAGTAATLTTAAYAAGDANATFTVATAGAVSTVTMAGIGASAAAAGSYGQLVSVTLKDAAAAAAQLSAGQTLTVAPNKTTTTIARINQATGAEAATAVGTAGISLTSTDFVDGVAYLLVRDSTATATDVVLTATGTGLLAASVTSTTTISSVTPATSVAVVLSDPTGASRPGSGKVGFASNGDTTSISSASHSYLVTYTASCTAAATNKQKVVIEDTDGDLTGIAGLIYDAGLVTLTCGTAGTSSTGTLTVSGALSTALDSFKVTVGSGTQATIASATAAAKTLTAYPANTLKAATASSTVLTGKVTDQFGAAVANAPVTLAVTGRNATTATVNLATDSTGYVSYTLTDASTSTTSLVSTVTFTATGASSQASGTNVVTITYGSDAALGVSTVTLETPTTLDTASSGITYSDIDASSTAGAAASTQTITATVKDVNGSLLIGVPVTFTTASTGVGILSTTVTVYTGAAGTAAATVYGWTAGVKTFTATAGGKTGTGTVAFRQGGATGTNSPTEVRNITAVASGNSIIVTAKDRFGNIVSGVPLWATRTGNGTFGGGSNTNGQTTAADGTAEFLFNAGSADSVVTITAGSATATPLPCYGQTGNLAGINVCSTATTQTAYTAATVGTTTTAETGIGASLSPAGNQSVTVNFAAAVNSADTAADAAAEATDAANAATDAANAAAEAADAATAAAQDAADAVAALSAQVASLISGLKSQLTALTNLVIKIQKKVKA